jgi:hypothetical protein
MTTLREFLVAPYSQTELDSEITLTAPPVDCELGQWGDWTNSGEPTPCVNGLQTQRQIRTRSILTPPSNGGVACGPLEEERFIEVACVPPVGPIPTINHKSLNLARLLVFHDYLETTRYERFQNIQLVLATGNPANAAAELESQRLTFHVVDIAAGGAEVALSSPEYQLLIDGVENATVTVPAGTTDAEFAMNPAAVSEGWHKVEIRPEANGETNPPWFVYVKKTEGQVPAQIEIPVVSGTHDLAHDVPYAYAMVPASFNPTPKPLVPRECPAFSDARAKTDLYRTNLAPVRQWHIYRPNVTPEGIGTTFNFQAYHWSKLTDKIPTLPLLDGPRGVGNVFMPTHVMVDRHGGAYMSDPWRVLRVSPEGVVKTRAGYRHKHPPSYHGFAQDLELVGDWSAIPVERNGFHEIWGIAWDPASLASDPNAAPIGGEQPHVTGPRLFVADTQNSRVCLLTFSATSFEAEPVVTEFLTGLNDPWDVVCVDGVLYVSERQSHRINAYDATSGAFIRTVVSGAALAYIDSNRIMTSGSTLSVIQAEQVVAPEGLFYQDGWLYYASKVMQQVRRVHLTTGEIQAVCNNVLNSNFMKIALSDGTFGPRGTVFVWTWSNAKFGFPEAWLPDTPANGLTNSVKWSFYGSNSSSPACGKGGSWETMGYGGAGGVGLGRLICGSSQEGLAQISLALPGDPTIDVAKYTTGRLAYIAEYRMVCGDHGYGYHQEVGLPWGVSEEIDYYLTVNGHQQ